MNILYSIIALGLLIIFHEIGHFLLARLTGMKVHEFAVGFGPSLFSFQWKGTTYHFRLFVLGGYVRIAGMHPDEEDAGEPNSFLGSAPWKRFLVLLAGPMANYFIAFLLFILIFVAWGLPALPRLQAVAPQSPLAAAGLRAQDYIAAVDDRPIRRSYGLNAHEQFQYIAYDTTKSLSLLILHQGKKHEVRLAPDKTGKLKKAKQFGLVTALEEEIFIKKIPHNSLIEKIGFKVGDRLLEIEGKKISQLFVFLRYLKRRTQKALQLKVLREGKIVTLTIPKADASHWYLPLQFDLKQKVIVRKVEPGTVAQASGLQPGTVILKANGQPLVGTKPISYNEKLKQALLQCTKKKLKLTVIRENSKVVLWLSKQKTPRRCIEGLTLHEPTVSILVASVLSKSVAAKMGLRAGDKIISLNRQKIYSLDQLIHAIKFRIYKPIELTVLRGKRKLTLKAPIAQDPEKWKLGFRPLEDFALERQGLRSALSLALRQTYEFNFLIWNGLKRILSGKQKAELTGPVGIVNQTQQAVRLGFNYFLRFVAIISIHLAFFNLLPIPALDGGRLLFLFTQQFARIIGIKDEFSVKIETVANIISFVLLFGLLILITFNDIYRLLFG